jgi:hypothetical protein
LRDFFFNSSFKNWETKKIEIDYFQKKQKKKLVQNNPSFLPTGKSLELGHGDSIERNWIN